MTRVPTRLENENGHGKVIEHEKLAKSYGMLLSVIKCYHCCPVTVHNFNFFCHHLEFLTNT